MIRSVKAIETTFNNMPVEIEEILKKLFIPETEQLKEIMNIISEHFGFIRQIVEIGDAIFKAENFEYTPPEYTIKIDSDLCCILATSQVFTRVAKPIRENLSVYGIRLYYVCTGLQTHS